MWHLICKLIKAVTLHAIITACHFISSTLKHQMCTLECERDTRRSSRVHKKKCWHDRTMGPFALADGSHQSEGSGKSRVHCALGFLTSRYGSRTVQFRAHVTVTVFLRWPGRVCHLLEGKSILARSLPAYSPPGEKKHKLHQQALFIMPLL